MKKFYLFLFLIFFTSDIKIAFSQENSIENSTVCEYTPNKKKSKKLLSKAKDKKYKVEERIVFLKACLEVEPDWPEAINELVLNQYIVYKVRGANWKSLNDNITKLKDLCPSINPYVPYYLGKYAFDKEDWANAVDNLKQFIANESKLPENSKVENDINEAKDMLSEAKYQFKIKSNPIKFDPLLVEGVSSKKNEYLAVLSPDNETCLYTRTTDVIDKNQVYASDKEREVFMFSKRADVNSIFDNGTLYKDPFNEGKDAYGGACLTPDNKKMYITICREGKAGYNNCDIYETKLIDGSWDEIKNVGPNINTDDGWESQPTISSDGKTIIFATARADSKSIDLYYSTKDAEDQWTRAQPLSKLINTIGKEKTPFLHSDSRTLYFSSDGIRGVGGFDIFFTKLDSLGNWGKPQNIGYPINTQEDEYGFFVSLDGHKGYFASSKLSKIGRGGIDIFNFNMPEDAKPEKVLFLKGVIKDEIGNPSSTAKIELKNLKTKQINSIDIDRRDGTYAAIVTLKQNEDIVLTIKQPNAVPTFTKYTIADTLLGSIPIKKDFVTQEIIVGKTYKLDNINYKSNSSQLTDESFLILDELMSFLQDNPPIKIAINGHTDNVGSAASNLSLSADRAYSVKEYLENKGIAKNRLQFNGFGDKKPINNNTTDIGRAQNRRTEFVILSKE